MEIDLSNTKISINNIYKNYNINNIKYLILDNLENKLNNNKLLFRNLLLTMSNLKSLSLCNNKIDNKFIDFIINNNINLTSIHLDNNNISKINNLNKIPKLKYLSLKNNKIQDIDFIKNNIKLCNINLSNNNINIINNNILNELKNLTTLFLNNNNISINNNKTINLNIDKLLYLWLDNNYISNINIKNKSITSLSLVNNKLNKIKLNIPSLLTLNLDNNNINNINLFLCINLRYLRAQNAFNLKTKNLLFNNLKTINLKFNNDISINIILQYIKDNNINISKIII